MKIIEYLIQHLPSPSWLPSGGQYNGQLIESLARNCQSCRSQAAGHLIQPLSTQMVQDIRQAASD